MESHAGRDGKLSAQLNPNALITFLSSAAFSLFILFFLFSYFSFFSICFLFTFFLSLFVLNFFFLLCAPCPMGSSFFFLVSTQCLQAVFPSTLLLPRGFELLIMHSVEERAEGRRRGAVVETSPHFPEKAYILLAWMS